MDLLAQKTGNLLSPVGATVLEKCHRIFLKETLHKS